MSSQVILYTRSTRGNGAAEMTGPYDGQPAEPPVRLTCKGANFVSSRLAANGRLLPIS